MALYRSRMGGTINRKQPSRSHLRKMGSTGDILDSIPKDILCNLDKPLDDGASTPVVLPRPVSAEGSEAHSTTPQPKPRPRAAPRKKPQPSPPTPDEAAKDAKKTPLAAPRTRAQTADNLDAMKPSQVSSEKSSEDEKSPPAKDSPKHPAMNGADKLSPAKAPKPLPAGRAPKLGPKPSPKSPGKPPAKDPVDLPAPSETAGQQVSPRQSRTGSLEKEAAATSSSDVDPSKLSVKEKALLAQKALASTPENLKPGPPRVARKPKPTPGTPIRSPETPEDGGLSMESKIRRAQSVEEEGSPHQKRKLPPGAINMFRMGAVPMFGPGSDRGRGSFVATSDPVARERNSVEGDISGTGIEENGGEATDAPADQRSSFHAVQVLPVPKPSSADDSGADLDDSTSPQAPPKFEHDVITPASPTAKGGGGEELAAEVDLDCVLTWTPDVTAAWLGQVGLGGYRQAFVEKEIHGYMLFDIDGHRIKVQYGYKNTHTGCSTVFTQCIC